MPIMAFILAGLVVLMIASGGYTFVVACIRRKEMQWLVEEEIKKTSYAKYYNYMAMADRFLKEHNAQNVYIQSYDGLKLHGLWIPAENPKGTILLAHGYRSTKYLDFALVYELYHQLGMNILVPDQRAHGQSEGKYITFGVKESRDMVSWLEFHNKEYGEIPVLLSGVSMGASTMLYLADQDLSKNVKGIIADCGFTSPKEIISSVFRNVIHLPAGPTLWVADLFARIFAGFSLAEKDTRTSLKNCKLPVMMVHGVEDGFVPCEMTRQGYAACTGPKELLLVENADHALSFVRDRERYTQMIRTFLQRYLEDSQ